MNIFLTLPLELCFSKSLSLYLFIYLLTHRSNTGDGFAARGSGWDSVSVRHAFIRKVITRLRHPSLPSFPLFKQSGVGFESHRAPTCPSGVFGVGLSADRHHGDCVRVHVRVSMRRVLCVAPPPRTCVTLLTVSLPQRTCWKIREGQPGALLGVIVRTHWLCFPLLFQFKH